MKLKRVFAYLIDMFIVLFISSFIFGIFMSNSNDIEKYNKVLDEYNEIYNYNGSGEISEERLIELQYEMQSTIKPIFIIMVGLYVLYFGVLAYLMKGQTLGKKLFKLQTVSVKDGAINPGLFILRAIILTNFIPEVIGLITLMVCSKNTWIQVTNITSTISYLMTFLMIGFVIFRDDERGLHDLICGTKVISTKEN